jgi:hypothetical protein
MEQKDYIIIGSGCSGVASAKALLDLGLKVTMLDVGLNNEEFTNSNSFLDNRLSDNNQYSYFIGNNLECFDFFDNKFGNNTTAPRKYIYQDIHKHIPTYSENFESYESLSYGGLGNGWGLGSYKFSKAELREVGLHSEKINTSYNILSDFIGISGIHDNAGTYTVDDLKYLQKPTNLNLNHQILLNRFNASKKYMNKKGFYLGRTPLALLTEDKNNRRSYNYDDMDFYFDNDKSAFRPRHQIDLFKKNKNFEYLNNMLVKNIEEINDAVYITAQNIISKQLHEFKARKIYMAAGALNTARIILNSKKLYDKKLPILTNPYNYLSCINPKMIGNGFEKKQVGFSQLSLFYDKNHENINTSLGSIYSYQSLLNYRLINNIPSGYKISNEILKMLIPSFLVIGIHHSIHQNLSNYIKLNNDYNKDGFGHLSINYNFTFEEMMQIKKIEKKFINFFLFHRYLPVKKINLIPGNSIHYGGTFPFNSKNGLKTHYNGKLETYNNVYICDSSSFNFLPAKGLTLTLMANSYSVTKDSIFER